jgi:HAMP domain-containing protein
MKETIEELPNNSSLRPQLVASIARNASVSQATIAEKLGVSKAAVSAALRQEDRSALQINRARAASAAPRKTDEAIAFAIDYWYYSARQTQKRDSEGKQLEEFYYDTTIDEIFECYRVAIIEKHLCKLDDLDSVDLTCGESEDKRFFEKLANSGNAVRRAKFASLRPKNVNPGVVRECCCPTCRDGYELLRNLSEATRNAHEACAHDAKHDADHCPLAEQCDEVQQMKQAVAVFAQHTERARAQRLHYQYLRDEGLAENEALLLLIVRHREAPSYSASRHR